MNSIAQAALDVQDRQRLAALEGIIERGLPTFIEVGQALLEIREQRLYRASHATFEAYCRERWGWSRIHAHRQIQAARVAVMLPMGNTPATERQTRELVPLLEHGEEAVRETWAEATETNAELTAADVRAAVQRRLTPEEDLLVWAEAQLDGPFTREDFDGGAGWIGWIMTKLLHHLHAPATTSLLLRMADEYRVPALRLAPADELVALLRLTVPYAKGAEMFETVSVSLNDMITLKLTAMRICGNVFGELECREKTQRLNRHLSPSPAAVHKKLLQRIDEALAQLLAENPGLQTAQERFGEALDTHRGAGPGESSVRSRSAGLDLAL